MEAKRLSKLEGGLRSLVFAATSRLSWAGVIVAWFGG